MSSCLLYFCMFIPYAICGVGRTKTSIVPTCVAWGSAMLLLPSLDNWNSLGRTGQQMAIVSLDNMQCCDGGLCTGLMIASCITAVLPGTFYTVQPMKYRDHFVYVPRQWEMMLQCNVVFHWLGACTKWSLKYVHGFVVFCFVVVTS